MPLSTSQESNRMQRLVEFVHGREVDCCDPDVMAVSRCIAAHGWHNGRAEGRRPRWKSIDALKIHSERFGPSVSRAQIDKVLSLTHLTDEDVLAAVESSSSPETSQQVLNNRGIK
jgi:hypothetical protein